MNLQEPLEEENVKLNSPEFLNIVSLGDSDLQIVLRLTDNRSLEQALALAPQIVLERVKACLSMRAGIMLEDAIENKPVDVEGAVAAQMKMTAFSIEVLQSKEPNPDGSPEKITLINHCIGTLFSEIAVKLWEQDLGPHKEHLYALKLAVEHHLLANPLTLDLDHVKQESVRITLAYLQGSIEHSEISLGLKSNAEEILSVLWMIHTSEERSVAA